MVRALGLLAAFACALASVTSARGEDDLDTERMIGDCIQSEPEKQPDEATPRNWAVLPQVGYSPEKGPNLGVKFTDRDVAPGHMTFDLEGIYAAKGQKSMGATLIAPTIWRSRLIGMMEGSFYLDPTKEFFGLGNNHVGSNPLSTNEYQRARFELTLGARPSTRLTLAVSAGYNQVWIRRGQRDDFRHPFTADLFPDLPGIDGGKTNPVSIFAVYNNREDITRPTRGWSIIARMERVDRALGNDFQFTRYNLDLSYLLPLLTRRQVLGVHVGGEYIDSKRRSTPYWELSSLGGSRDLRGFFQDRFLGRAKVILNGEYRLKLLDFDFFDIWNVRIDGVAFGDMGRVFLDQNDVSSEFRLNRKVIPRIFEDFRYSYGPGFRIALGEAILARIDAGFSNEEVGLIYLTFGHTF